MEDIRKAYASRGTVDHHASEAKQESSVPIAEMEWLPSLRMNVSDGQPDAVQPTPVPPFITPYAKSTVGSDSAMFQTAGTTKRHPFYVKVQVTYPHAMPWLLLPN